MIFNTLVQTTLAITHEASHEAGQEGDQPEGRKDRIDSVTPNSPAAHYITKTVTSSYW